MFPVDKVAKIWDLAICNSNIIPIFAATIMCDLKDKLLLMNLNDCMSNIRNLEGIIDLNSCLNFAGMIYFKIIGFVCE